MSTTSGLNRCRTNLHVDTAVVRRDTLTSSELMCLSSISPWRLFNARVSSEMPPVWCACMVLIVLLIVYKRCLSCCNQQWQTLQHMQNLGNCWLWESTPSLACLSRLAQMSCGHRCCLAKAFVFLHVFSLHCCGSFAAWLQATVL